MGALHRRVRAATGSASGRCCSPSTTSPGAATTATPTARSPGCWSSACVPIVNENDTVATSRDPVRRQRPAGRAGRAPGARRRAAAAQRRRRPLRRRPRAARAPRRSPTCAATADLAGVDIGRARLGRVGHRRHGHQGRGGADRHRRRASRWCSPPPSRPAAALAGEPVGTLFHPTGRRRPTRLLWLAHATEAKGRLVLDAGAVRRGHRARARRCCPPGSPGSRARSSAGDPVDLVGPDGAAGGPRAGQLRLRGAARAAGPLHP